MKGFNKFILGIVLGILIASLPVAFAISHFFRDVQRNSWYEQAVNNLVEINVIRGYKDGTFRPFNNINRAEVAVMLDRFKKYVDEKISGSNEFESSNAENENPQIPLAIPSSEPKCSALPPATGKTVTVGSLSELKNAVTDANKTGNVTIFIRDGTYNLDNGLWVSGNNITFRSLSGNRDAVILKGKGMNGGVTHVFWAAGKDITITDMTIGWVSNHPIQVHGELDADRPHVQNVHVVDAGQQLFKVSYDSAKPALGSDGGIVECSVFEYSAGVGPQAYIGGIDVHNAKNWIIRDNVFKAIRAPSGGLAEHAVHFWSASQNTVVERNIIINSDRGIGFGLGGHGHEGGIIRNNMIYHDASNGDVGIGLENARNAKVYNNTIFHENGYANAIEYRFSGTNGVEIINNLTNKLIVSRDSGQAKLENNITNAQKNWFVSPAAGNLRLKDSISSVVDKGTTLPSVTADIDGQTRSFGNYDIGADEL